MSIQRRAVGRGGADQREDGGEGGVSSDQGKAIAVNDMDNVVVASMLLLARSARAAPMGATPAVWVGIGVVGAAIGGVVLFDEAMPSLRVVFFAPAGRAIDVLEKLDASGAHVWSKKWGGVGEDQGSAIAVRGGRQKKAEGRV